MDMGPGVARMGSSPDSSAVGCAQVLLFPSFTLLSNMDEYAGAYRNYYRSKFAWPLLCIKHRYKLVGKPQTGRIEGCVMVGRMLDASGRDSVGWDCAAVLKPQGRQGLPRAKQQQVIPGETKA